MYNHFVSAERSLWCAVIERAFLDAGFIAEPRGRHRERKGNDVATHVSRMDYNEALHWLLFDRKDFIRVCSFAGVTPSVIRAAAKGFFN